jgi:hypothetical protein
MKLLMGAFFAVAISLISAQAAQAQVVYYPAAAPVPVTTYYAPAPAPVTYYYAPPVSYRPLIGGTVSGWRYNYPARTYVYPAATYPASTVAYYPAW